MIAVAQHYPHDASYWFVLVVFAALTGVCGSYLLREWREPGPSRSPVLGAWGSHSRTSLRADSCPKLAPQAPPRAAGSAWTQPPVDTQRESAPFDWSTDV